GETARVFAAPREAYTKSLIGIEPVRRARAAAAETSEALACHGLQVAYGRKLAVDNVDLVLRRGRTLAVVGESGSGKSTLARALLRLQPSKGEIRWMGRPVQGLEGAALRRARTQAQIVFQDPFGSLSPRLSVAEIVEEGLIAQGLPLSARERRDAVARALSDVGLDTATMDRYPHEFSGGQRQRIAIARAILKNAPILVLDEATSALDVETEARVKQAIDRLRKHRTTFIIAHRLSTIREADLVVFLDHGKIIEMGNYDQLSALGGRFTSLLRTSGLLIEETSPSI
uniref:ATP-binding cassette domain-containing protein n=1 Tax=uncultured Rhizobium sp. TaxID=155567 RepID=UPI00261EB4F1